MNLERRSFLKLFCIVGSQALIPAAYAATGNHADASADASRGGDQARVTMELLGYSLYNYGLLVNDIEDAFVAELADQLAEAQVQVGVLASQETDASAGPPKNLAPLDPLPPSTSNSVSNVINVMKKALYAHPDFAIRYEKVVDAIVGSNDTRTNDARVRTWPASRRAGLRECITSGSAALLRAGRFGVGNAQFTSHKTDGLRYVDAAVTSLSEFDALGSPRLSDLANNLRNALRAVDYMTRQLNPGVEFVSAHADQGMPTERFDACNHIYAILEDRIQPSTPWVLDMALAVCVPPVLWPGIKLSDRESLLAMLLGKVPNLSDPAAAASDLGAIAVTVPG